MKPQILYIHHYDSALCDTATRHLGALGFTAINVRPFQGEAIPALLAGIDGVVIFGGSQNVTELEKHPYLRDEIDLIHRAMQQNIPLLGICLGGQLIAHALGGQIRQRDPRECEFGFYALEPTAAHPDWIPSPFLAVEAHYEEFSLPPGATRLAGNARFPNQAFRYGDKVFALQFHPETSHEIFLDWQQADWAMYDVPGAQTREQQDKLVEQHSAIQQRWFEGFLESLFKPSSAISQ